MNGSMRAVVVQAPGEPEVVTVRTLPIHIPSAGQVLIRVKAFGLNKSELHFRQGPAYSGSFPRIPGIEASGIVQEAPAANSSREPKSSR